MTDVEIERLAERMDLSDSAFRQRYTRRLRGGEISLIEKDNHDCIFYHREVGCTVYDERPRQCRTWPFWHSVVLSPETWGDTAVECPGVNTGEAYSRTAIEASAADDGTSHSPLSSNDGGTP